MSTATAKATASAPAAKEWVSPHEAARLLGIKRDTLLKYAASWGIRVRKFPRLDNPYGFRIVHLGDLLRFREELEAAEMAVINETARQTA